MTDWETTLQLTSHDPCRTTLEYVGSPTEAGAHKVAYTITTNEDGPRPITSYTDSSGYTFATLEWRSILPDQLQIADGEKQVIGKWLKKAGMGKHSCVVSLIAERFKHFDSQMK